MKTCIPTFFKALGAALMLWPGLAFGQGSAFTYEGRLASNGTPANGSYDLRFAVYDSSAGPTVVAGPLTNSSVAVANGLFAVTLDFGAGVFTGPARWLDIAVRTNGGGTFAALSSRQPLTPSPYAIYAATASNVVSGAVVTSLNNLKDNLTLAAGSNVTITPSGSTLTFAAAGAGGSGIWSLLNNNAYFTAGNVGIGTNSPTVGVRLEVNGTTKVNAGGGGGYVYFHTPAGESGMSIIGNNRADVRFNGESVKLVAGLGSGAPPPENGITVNTLGNVGIGSEAVANYRLYLDGDSLFLGDTQFAGDLLSDHLFSDNANISQLTLGQVNGPLYINPGGSGTQFPLNVADASGNSLLVLQAAPNVLFMYGDAAKNSGGTSWYAISDRRLKQDIRAFEPGLKEVLQLRTVRFRYRAGLKAGLTSDHEEVGFIAQEVREVIPEAVTQGADGYLMLKADPIHWAAINAIQQLSAKLEKEQAENAKLQRRLEKLEERMSQIDGSRE